MTRTQKWQRGLTAITLLIMISLAGCLDEPEIDERWTVVEFLDVAPQPQTVVQPNQTLTVTVKGRITYRQILTGFLVAEVRQSTSLSPNNVLLDPAEHTLDTAGAVDLVLANSVTAGRVTRAVTGFDHLMQDFDLTFSAQVPDTSNTSGLFVVLYMGDGDEIQLPGGQDSLVVTPFVSTDREVLHSGFPLDIAPAGGVP